MTEDLIYHYTTTRGLLGILESRELWASDLRYMNDLSELKYANNLINKEIDKSVGSDFLTAALIDYSPGRILDLFAVYACCFCEDGDQLSQWRAYTEKGTGFALGFNRKLIKQNSSDGPVLDKVIYEPEDQINSINPTIEEYVKDLQAYMSISSKLNEQQRLRQFSDIGHKLFSANIRNFFFFKNPVFREENEWRIVQPRFVSDPTDVCFREMRGTIIPYIKIPLLKPDYSEQLPLEKIIQGPLADPKLGLESLGKLLKTYKYRVEIEASKIPIRF
jgi:hypothetical protein